MSDFDFDPADRPTVYPSSTYSKYIFPQNQGFANIYGDEQNAGGQMLDREWQTGVCSHLLYEYEKQGAG
jgi:hypothetical protein